MPTENPQQSGASRPSTVAVLLAAGAGSRFTDGRHKLLAELDSQGNTVIERSLRNLIEARIGPIVIITGALTRDDLATNPSVANYLAAPSVTTHHNPTWAAGQSTSVRVAIDAAEQIGADAVVIGLADQPFITPDAWRTVAAGLGAITVATYDGRRGNPVRLHADVWDQLPHDGDVGARSLMQLRPELVTEVSCTGSSADIDTLEDLHRWQSN
ncbi:MAG: nucleotidyltransferase family protein [Actinomycetota bacterium]|jgi:molybdenum cofactor cytidylyltransferase|uniref:nucleotidyltransferase family protein n=1 Tax=uncultured Ilumatobacter sp. TaxID=879968 RepID=UPI00374FDABE|nr:nucleotidyltransferase family protein [Actinomycetota bacterium]